VVWPVKITSVGWKVTASACRTTRAPTLIIYSWRLFSDQSPIASGISMQRRKVARE
jgi:hypothetical protein